MQIVCVYKSGGDFDAEYVVRLFFSLEKYTIERDIDFFCYTDVPEEIPDYIKTRPLNHGLHSWWSKMEIFEPRINYSPESILFNDGDEESVYDVYNLHEDILYFDLDTVISEDGIDEMIEYLDTDEQIPMIMLSDFYFPDRLASGIMYLPKGVQSYIWYSFYEARDYIMKNCRGDQNFLERLCRQSPIRTTVWDNIFPDYIASYKAHVIKSYPKHLEPKEVELSKTKIICYHGLPRPKSTEWAFID